MSSTNLASPLAIFSDALSALVARHAPGVVAVHSNRSRSSGFLWKPDLVVTADEALVEDGALSVTLAGGETVPAILVGSDPATDVALLRIARPGLVPVELSEGGISAGALTLALGSQGGAALVALGIVSQVGPAWLSSRGGQIDALVELGLSLRPAAEGGLALDAAGRAFGMVVFGPRRRTLVIPAATIGRVASRLASHGRVARGYLGLGLQPVRLGAGEGTGIMVMGVDARGPAASAGIRQGDVIVAWAGQPVGSVQSLLRGLGPETVGTTLAVTVRRAGEPATFHILVGERPPA
jgi:S1-C subfamily serine protease